MHGQPTILILTICSMGAGCGGFSAELGSVPDAAVQVDQTNIPVLHQDLGLPPADVEPHPPDLVPLDVASDLMPDAQAPDLKPDAPAGRLVNTLAGSGAYAIPLASNYNASFRPAIVFIKEGEARLVRRRETLDDLTRRDIL